MTLRQPLNISKVCAVVQKTIVQFLKWPRAGRVKTRLAASIGDEAARQVHVELCQSVHAQLNDCDAEYVMHIADMPAAAEHDDFDVWLKSTGARVTTQVQGDLGVKMASVLQAASANNHIIIVGSDCPSLTRSYLEKAFEALQRSDIVLGPAEDGGYVLIGARTFHKDLFNAVEWGGGHVLDRTLNNAKALSVKVELLAVTWDVDTLEDLERWRNARLGLH